MYEVCRVGLVDEARIVRQDGRGCQCRAAEVLCAHVLGSNRVVPGLIEPPSRWGLLPVGVTVNWALRARPAPEGASAGAETPSDG